MVFANICRLFLIEYVRDMKYLIPLIVSLVVGGLFSWAYLTAYGFVYSYFIYLVMVVCVIFLAADAWRNRDK